MARTDVTFDSWGDRCAAWLYRPDEAEQPVACVVMAHGFSATREERLDAYAQRFAAAGLAALVFDYRGFGDSEGEPRQLLDIGRQQADWAAAIAFARTLPGVDPDRIAVWGSSFSGGHVLDAAARDRRIAAAVAQVPFVDGLATVARVPPATLLRLTLAGLRDELSRLSGSVPVAIAAAGPPGTLAVMTSPDAQPGFEAIVPPGSRWRNEVLARIALRVGIWRPGRLARRIGCPLLVAVADDDAITPPEAAVRAAKAAPHGEVRHYPLGHFDVYLGEPFERAVSDQVDFLSRHLKAAGSAPSLAGASGAAPGNGRAS